MPKLIKYKNKIDGSEVRAVHAHAYMIGHASETFVLDDTEFIVGGTQEMLYEDGFIQWSNPNGGADLRCEAYGWIVRLEKNVFIPVRKDNFGELYELVQSEKQQVSEVR